MLGISQAGTAQYRPVVQVKALCPPLGLSCVPSIYLVAPAKSWAKLSLQIVIEVVEMKSLGELLDFTEGWNLTFQSEKKVILLIPKSQVVSTVHLTFYPLLSSLSFEISFC